MWRFSERNVQQKWACPMSENPALFREHMDLRFVNVLFKMLKLQANCNYIHYSATYWSTCAIFGMEELCPILSVPYKFQSSQHNSLAEINVCCLSCNKPRPH